MKKPKKAKRKVVKKRKTVGQIKVMDHASFCKCKTCMAAAQALRTFLKMEIGGND